jgi:hypothetical protein
LEWVTISVTATKLISASSGWRPTRFFDIAGTSRTIAFGESIPDPFHSLDFELGVHGTPYKGFWYDIGLFWMLFDNRTETQNIGNTDFIILNTGSSRNRGLEGELSYDFLAPFQHPPIALQPEPDKGIVDKSKAIPVPGVSPMDYHPLKLIAFSNVQYSTRNLRKALSSYRAPTKQSSAIRQRSRRTSS